jgi:hypothetical protein
MHTKSLLQYRPDSPDHTYRGHDGRAITPSARQKGAVMNEEATMPRDWAVEELDDFACAGAFEVGQRAGRAVNRLVVGLIIWYITR